MMLGKLLNLSVVVFSLLSVKWELEYYVLYRVVVKIESVNACKVLRLIPRPQLVLNKR